MNTFPIARNFVSREGKREKKSKNPSSPPNSLNHAGEWNEVQGMRRSQRNRVQNIPSGDLVVHNLPDIGSGLSVTLVAVHLGHDTHLTLADLPGSKRPKKQRESSGRQGEKASGKNGCAKEPFEKFGCA